MFEKTLTAFRVRQDFRQFVTFVTFCDLFQPSEMAYGIRPLMEQNDILILNNFNELFNFNLALSQ